MEAVEAVEAVGAVGAAEEEAAELRVVHFARRCRRTQPRKRFPPLKRTKIEPTSTSWIGFLRSTQQTLYTTGEELTAASLSRS